MAISDNIQDFNKIVKIIPTTIASNETKLFGARAGLFMAPCAIISMRPAERLEMKHYVEKI